jgi:divalent metal cation (Fe/Co/Zn/Cd) transporter
MHNHKIERANKDIRFVTNLGIAGNIVLSAVKVGVGYFAGSMALVADGIHSISDMTTDIAKRLRPLS